MSSMTRRDFLKLIQRVGIATGLAAIVGPIVAYFYPAKLEEVPADAVLVGPEAELPVGASRTVRFGRYPALVIHTEDGVRAYSAVCTHFACIVKWDEATGQIVCPCHDGFFAAEDGRVLSGPPPSGLEPLAIEIAGGKIYVGGRT
jgi:Rieske Fe-S protein